jgi:hypothetical protein
MDPEETDKYPATDAPDNRFKDRFPLSRWAELARFWNDGTPLPLGVDWDSYSVELIWRPVIPEVPQPGSFPSGTFRMEGGESETELNADGSLHSFHRTGRNLQQHVRTVIRHPDTVAHLQWDWDPTPFGRIAIVGLETDPDLQRSWKLLWVAIPLLRDYEWQGKRKAGRPPVTEIEVRRDLKEALARCRAKGRKFPSLTQLAEEHDNAWSEIGSLSRSALRDRMRQHPEPFRDLVPWIKSRVKE